MKVLGQWQIRNGKPKIKSKLTMKQQTAVEWLLSQDISIDIGSGIRMKIPISDEIIKQAKEMERQQLEQFYNHGSLSLLDTGHGDTFKQYYNETYGGEK